jgi:ABC-type multidrug transport system fused ATPase/permease subunit
VNLPANRGRWRAYAACFRNHRLSLFLLTLAGLAQSFAWVPGAAVLRRIFDQILPDGPHPGTHVGMLRPFWIAVAELMALQLAGLLLAWWIRIRALRLSQDVLATLRARAVEHFYLLPRAFHTQADLEKLYLTLVHETGIIDVMNNAVTTQMLPGAGGAVVLFWILMRIEPVYAVVLAVVAPALLLLNRMTQRHAYLRQEQVRRAWHAYSRGVRFMIQAFELTRLHAAEKFEISRQTRNILDVRDISLDLNRFDAGQQVLQGFLLLTCTLGALLAGGWSLASGHTTRGQVMVFYVTAALFAVQVRSIVESIPAIRRGLRSFGEVDALMHATEREPYQGTVEVGTIESMRMEDAWFGYREDVPVLTGAAFEIRRGEQIALIGANGAGKSTIAHLITALYRPARGGLFVNGVAYDEVDVRSLRARMAILPQNPFLFPGTIRENLTYGSVVFGDPEVRQALEWSGASGFVDELAKGLDSEIGEHGVLLSGGQRQKLVLARALLRRPDFLIFDEPTNHLDEEAIATLLHNMARLPFRPAVLMISHDPVAIRHASRAFRLEGGCLREEALEARW